MVCLLGTSNSAAAVLRGGRPLIIPSAEGISLGEFNLEGLPPALRGIPKAVNIGGGKQAV